MPRPPHVVWSPPLSPLLQSHFIDPTQPHQLAYNSPNGPNSSSLRAFAHLQHVLSPVGSERPSLDQWPRAVQSGSGSLVRVLRNGALYPTAPGAAHHLNPLCLLLLFVSSLHARPELENHHLGLRVTDRAGQAPHCTLILVKSLLLETGSANGTVYGCLFLYGPQTGNEFYIFEGLEKKKRNKMQQKPYVVCKA